MPGDAETLDKFWSLLIEGRDAITPVPSDRWDLEDFYHPDVTRPGKLYTSAGGYVKNIDQFDADFFGISPREASRIDPQHRLLLEMAWEALESAGQSADRLAGTNTSVYVGISGGDYGHIQYYDMESVNAYTNVGNAASIAANRLSHFFDLHGPSMAVDTACSSSLVAMHEACEGIWSGETSMALVGGINIVLRPQPTVGFCKASMLSPRNHCHSFGANADGYVRAEGGAVFVLKALADAEADGDTIHGLILASGVNSDGHTKGIFLPSEDAQARLLRDVYEMAGVRPRDVSYIEAHGTGTPAGDPIECAAIGSVMGAGRTNGDKCYIGSVKSNIGHLEPAAGMAGLIKVLLAMKNRVLPASINSDPLNPKIPFDELNLEVVREKTPLPRRSKPLVMGVNSFGFGGTNAHVVVQEYRPRNGVKPEVRTGSSAESDTPLLPLLLSAQSESALKQLASGVKEQLRGTSAPSLYDLCHSAAMRRSHLDHRLVVHGSSAEEMADKLAGFVEGDVPEDTYFESVLSRPAKVAFVFCGNGPQWWAMGQQLLRENTQFANVVRAIDAVFAPMAGWSIVDELNSAEEESRLAGTEYAQPTLFAVQLGIFDVLKSRGLHPGAVLGHSVGEVAAAYAAGAFTLQQAVRVIYERSRCQAVTAGKGRMAALGMAPDNAAKLIERFDGRLVIAGQNSPGSVTLSGDEDAIHELAPAMEEEGTFYRILDLDYAFHSNTMDPIRVPLQQALKGLKPGPTSIRFVSTVTGADLAGPKLNARYWWRNVREPVVFAAATEALIEDGFEIFVEIGPHPVLSTYIAECAKGKERQAKAVASLRRNEPEEPALRAALSTAHALGAALDLDALFPRKGRFVALPRYPWQRERHWHEGPRAVRDHPLLGVREKAADATWSREIDSPNVDYLNDHVVQGAVVFPAAGYLEMALAAAHKTSEATCYDLEDIDIRKALAIPEGQTPFIQISVSQDDGSFHICSRPTRTEGSWTTNVVGRLGVAASKVRPDPVKIDEIRARLSERVSKDGLYKAAARRGLQYGKRFQGVKEIWAGKGEVLGRVALPRSLRGDAADYLLHPSVLDASFQVVLGMVAADDSLDDSAAFLPVQIRRLRYYMGAKAPAYCHAQVVRMGARSMLARLRLLDGSGGVVADIDGFRFQRVELGGHGAYDVPFYEFIPELRPHSRMAKSVVRSSRRDLEKIAKRITGLVPQMLDDLELNGFYQAITPKYDRLAASYVAKAFEELGVRGMPFSADTLLLPLDLRQIRPGGKVNGGGDPLHASVAVAAARTAVADGDKATVRAYLKSTLPQAEVESWPRTKTGVLKVDRKTLAKKADLPEVADILKPIEGAVQPHYRRLLGHFIDLAAVHGFLRRAGEMWEFVPDAKIPDPQQMWRDLIAEYSSALPELLLLGRCGEHLAPILTGEQDPLQIINLGPLEHLYESGPNFQIYSHMTAEAIQDIVRALPKGQALRVLEIGAGTGATTSHIVPHLPKDLTEYVFTDVSDVFLASAEVKFADYPFMRYAILDIERDPIEQGFDPHGYDIVVAANVLHATKDMMKTLERTRSLIARDGLFLLLETHRHAMIDIVFGLLKGWWAFEDLDLRPDAPVLEPDVWPGTLEAAGFADPILFNEARDGASPLQSIVLSRNPSLDLGSTGVPASEEAKGVCLLLTDEGADGICGVDMAGALASAGRTVVTARPGDSFGRCGDGEYVVDAADPKSMVELLKALKADDVDVAEVVHLWGLSTSDETEADALVGLQDRRCMSAIYFIQALQRAMSDSPPRLWLVTAGAMDHPGQSGPSNPSQAPLWGLGRVIQNEHSDLFCRLVDLYPHGRFADAGAQLAKEVCTPDGETEILLSPGARFVNRIRRTSIEEQAERHRPAKQATAKAFQLDFISQGALDNLYLRAVPKPTPGEGQVVIEVRAAGLNFRDVMWAMGMLPEEALENGFSGPTLGMECAGTVVSVGKGVKGVAVGDDVIAFASSCFGKYVLANTIAVAPKPARLTFSEAATVPTVFFTAYYALDTLARLEPGERVLIHGAAGGVGLAALQIAKHRGAEVFATAGTPEKRDFVRMLGADHVLDSRSLEFADQIVEITGGRGVDVVLNSLAGEAIYRNLKLLKPFGRFLEIGKRDLYANSKMGLRPFSNNISYFAIDADQFLIERAPLAGRIFSEVIELIESGAFQPLVHRVFPISRVVDAFRYMQQSKQIGKVVVTMDDPTVAAGSTGPRQFELRADASYLITGGLSGLGLATAKRLVERGARNVILVGRRGAATPEAKKGIAEMQKAGARVVVGKADASREEDLKRVIEVDAKGLPPLRGVVHAAMVLEDGIILQGTRDQFAKVMAPKMLGALHLHRLTRDLPLDFFVLYSSATTMLGNPGQFNYVAANLYLESLAAHRRSLGLPALAVAWGAILDVGYLTYNEDIRAQMEARMDLKSVSASDSLDAMEQHALAGTVSVSAAHFNWPKTLKFLPSGPTPKFDQIRAQGGDDAGDSAQSDEIWALLAELTEEERQETVTQLIAEQVAKVLRMSPSKLDVNKSLLDMGIDSLMGVEMKMVIDKQFGVDLPAMELMGGASIAQLAGRILKLGTLPAAEKAKAGHDQTQALYEEIDKEVDDLSDEVLDTYLVQLAADEKGLAEGVS